MGIQFDIGKIGVVADQDVAYPSESERQAIWETYNSLKEGALETIYPIMTIASLVPRIFPESRINTTGYVSTDFRNLLDRK